VSAPAGGPSEQGSPQGVAATIAEVSERAALLVREEIELAKAEIAEKTARLARGAAIGVAAGVFVVTALFFILVGCAWLLYYELPIGNQFTYFWGFFIMAAILIVLGVLAGLAAARAVRSSAPPVPELAIEQARKIRDTVAASGDSEGSPVSGGSVPVPVPIPLVPPSKGASASTSSIPVPSPSTTESPDA
jgi:uncharacterized membrane protein YqjE